MSEPADHAAVVTILSVKPGDMRDPSNIPVIGGDGGRYYQLPDGDYADTVSALKRAGFVAVEHLIDVANRPAED